MEKELETVNWLKSSKYRILTLKHLNNSPKTPSELADILFINRASISRILKDLNKKGLVDCTKERARTKLYFLTNKAIKIIEDKEFILGVKSGKR